MKKLLAVCLILVLASLPGLSLADEAGADNEATAKMVQELSLVTN
ncbi:MAG: hypothetical protein ACOX27_00315 [Caldicoprobacterales bacterium]